MKKILSLIIGSTVLAGYAVVNVDASRDAYHAYMYKRGYYNENYEVRNPQNRAVRPTSNSIFNTKQRRVSVDQSENAQSGRSYKNFRASRENAQRWAARADQRTTSGVSRTFSDRRGPWNGEGEGRVQPTFSVLPEIGKGNSVVTDRFVVEIPKTWTVEETANGIVAGERGFDMSLSYETYDCGEIGFFSCGVVLSKNDNDKTGVYTSSRVERLFSKTFKFLANNDVTPTYTESFAGVENGKDIFVTRYHVSDGEGGIYTLKVQSSLYNASTVVAKAKKIFNSFHIRGEETISVETGVDTQ